MPPSNPRGIFERWQCPNRCSLLSTRVLRAYLCVPAHFDQSSSLILQELLISSCDDCGGRPVVIRSIRLSRPLAPAIRCSCSAIFHRSQKAPRRTSSLSRPEREDQPSRPQLNAKTSLTAAANRPARRSSMPTQTSHPRFLHCQESGFVQPHLSTPACFLADPGTEHLKRA